MPGADFLALGLCQRFGELRQVFAAQPALPLPPSIGPNAGVSNAFRWEPARGNGRGAGLPIVRAPVSAAALPGARPRAVDARRPTAKALRLI